LHYCEQKFKLFSLGCKIDFKEAAPSFEIDGSTNLNTAVALSTLHLQSLIFAQTLLKDSAFFLLPEKNKKNPKYSRIFILERSE